jgi:hypothetical protein
MKNLPDCSPADKPQPITPSVNGQAPLPAAPYQLPPYPPYPGPGAGPAQLDAWRRALDAWEEEMIRLGGNPAWRAWYFATHGTRPQPIYATHGAPRGGYRPNPGPCVSEACRQVTAILADELPEAVEALVADCLARRNGRAADSQRKGGT